MEFREFIPNTREEESDNKDLRKTLKIIAEGRATEYYYFTALTMLTGHNRLLPNLQVKYIDKIDESQDESHPPKLYDWVKADKSKIEGYGKAGNEYEYYIVFDLDRSRREKANNKVVTYDVMKDLVKDEPEIFLLNTNPCFELWLLLHYNEYEKEYLNDVEVFKNRKLKYISNMGDLLDESKNKQYLTHLIYKICGINTKKRSTNEEADNNRRTEYKKQFIDKIDIALNNEIILCNSIVCMDKSSSNIGKHIKRIIEPIESQTNKPTI